MGPMMIAASVAAAQGGAEPRGTGFDLEVSNLSVVSLEFVDDRYEIGFDYTVTNVGGVAFNPEGPNPTTDNDNASIQTYLVSAPDPSLPDGRAAGGWAILGAPVLAPGESFTGRLFANTAQLPDPLVFGDRIVLAARLQNTGEEPERMGNNLAFATVPSPAGTTALGVMGVLACTRRRGK